MKWGAKNEKEKGLEMLYLIYMPISKKPIAKEKSNFINRVFLSDARNMKDIPNNSVHLIVTSPPYYNVKNYSLDGYQKNKVNIKAKAQIGDIKNYDVYIKEMLAVWKECFRVLRPNGKLIINTPLMPIPKAVFSETHTRKIFNIASDIETSILKSIKKMYLYDVFIWNRTNPRKGLMFGSYPHPRNFYAQNTIEFVTVFVKDGKSENNLPLKIKKQSRLTQKEWVQFTKQVWDIPVPNKKDIAFGTHSALMPEEIVERSVRLFSFVGDVVLDPFAGSGTTLKVAKEWGRNYIGYEAVKSYSKIINAKLKEAEKYEKFK